MGTTKIELNSSQIAIEDPETTTKWGRPPKPKRMKTMIEQVKQKMKQQGSNKKKKATTNENTGKNIRNNYNNY